MAKFILLYPIKQRNQIILHINDLFPIMQIINIIYKFKLLEGIGKKSWQFRFSKNYGVGN